MPRFYDTCAGPIADLYLPPVVWGVLRRENIATLDQLRANAARLEQFEGIAARMAQVIRQALAQFARSEEQPSGKNPNGSWGA
jgi:DNA-directed RNA polymerase alpha subunit